MMLADFFKRWRWGILIAGLLALGLGYAFWPEAAPVDIARVSRGAMVIGVTDDGVTRAEEFYVVSAPVTGYLTRIELKAGDRVDRGTLITRMTGAPASPLDSRSRASLVGALSAAQASVRGLSASLDQSRRDLSRAEKLATDGFLPRAQLEAARTRVATAQAGLAQARAEAARISAELAPVSGASSGASVPVRAPASGSVLSLINESAGVIAEGTPIMTIGDPAQIEAVVDLLSREAVRVKPGDPVQITEWGGKTPLTGKVERIEPYGRLKISALGIEEQRVNVIIAFDPASAPRAARLGHGYQIEATIVLWSRPDALRVPIGALYRGRDGDWRVFVRSGDRARERTVRLGQINDEWGEVLAGLKEGDEVVLNPASAIREGVRIAPR